MNSGLSSQHLHCQYVDLTDVPWLDIGKDFSCFHPYILVAFALFASDQTFRRTFIGAGLCLSAGCEGCGPVTHCQGRCYI